MPGILYRGLGNARYIFHEIVTPSLNLSFKLQYVWENRMLKNMQLVEIDLRKNNAFFFLIQEFSLVWSIV